jgi:restriction system protein
MNKPLKLLLYEKFVKEHYCKQSSSVIKGKTYERQVGQALEMKGYSIEYRGIDLGKEDDGIDLIAHKNDEILLVQCKNHKYPIKQKDIRAFVGDFCVFLKEHPEYKRERTFAYFFSTSSYKKSSFIYAKDKNFLVLKTLQDSWKKSSPTKQQLLLF